MAMGSQAWQAQDSKYLRAAPGGGPASDAWSRRHTHVGWEGDEWLRLLILGPGLAHVSRM